MDASNTQGAQETPAPAAGSSHVVLVPECESTAELFEFADRLSCLLATAPTEVTLRFVGLHHMEPDPTLILYEVLQQKPPGTVLITEAWSSLTNGSALVWLLGDRRRIRPTAWLFFRKAKPKQEGYEMPNEVETFFGIAPGIDLREVDYNSVLRLAGRFLPVRRMLGEPITAHMLAEYRLLDGQAADSDEVETGTVAGPVCPISSARREARVQQPAVPKIRTIPEA